MVQFLVSNLRTQDGRQGWVFDLHGIRDKLLTQLSTDQSRPWSEARPPAQLVRGGLSEHFAEAEFRNMLARNLRARGAVVPNAGHWLHVDNLVDTARVVLDFLKTVEKKSGDSQ
jgi:pimeloyl-ACP methyl ester carboxylesterase